MGRTFVTADTHFGHSNIIGYCGRPYKSVDEMNRSLVSNWNSTVSPDDTVIFLGDLNLGGSREDWLSRLNGNKVLLRGNHDRHGQFGLETDFEGEKFLFTHFPPEFGVKSKYWHVHGHQHDKGKLIDINKRTMCVSTELTCYRPIEMRQLLGLRKQGSNIKRLDSLPSSSRVGGK